MEEDVFDDRPYCHLADFFVALPLIEVQVARVAGVDDQALGGFVLGAPLMHRFQQLLAIMLALELRVHAKQRQQVHGTAGQAGEHRGVVIQVAPRSEKPAVSSIRARQAQPR